MRGEDNAPTLKLLTHLASTLSDSNLPGVLEAFSKSMPGYGELAANLGALTNQYDVICTIEIREESGNDTRRKADTEWFVQMKSKQDEGPTERRTVAVQLTTERIAGKWRIVTMQPQSVLAPPRIR